MRNIAVYARVSTDEQAAVEEGSIKNQIESLQRFVQGEQLKNNGSYGKIFDTYIDDGYSGKNLQRPAIKKLLQDISKSRIDTILITEVSRLSRATRDWIDLRTFFEEKNVSFISLRQSFDTSTAMGRAMLSFAIEFAQLEREQTAERVKFSSHSRKSRGLWTGGSIPFGYRATDRPGYLEIDEVKKVLAESILDTFLNKAGSLTKTVEIINAAGFLRESGTPWTVPALGNWIKGYAIVGKVALNIANKDVDQSRLKESEKFLVIDAVWESIIPFETWKEANELIERNFQRLKSSLWETHEYLFTGILECYQGKRFSGASGKSSTGKKIAYYRHNGCSCGIPSVRATEVESKLRAALKKLAKDHDLVRSLVDDANEKYLADKPDFDEALSEATKKREEIIAKLDAITDMALGAESDSERRMWLDKSRRLQEESERLEARIATIRQHSQTFGDYLLNSESIVEALKPYENGFTDLPLASKQRVIHSSIEKIIVEKSRLVLRLKNPTLTLGMLPEAKTQCIPGGQFSEHLMEWLLRTGSNRRPGD